MYEEQIFDKIKKQSKNDFIIFYKFNYYTFLTSRSAQHVYARPQV